MKFTERQIAFFKSRNIEPTEEKFDELIAYYKEQNPNDLTDDDLSAVSAGVRLLSMQPTDAESNKPDSNENTATNTKARLR